MATFPPLHVFDVTMVVDDQDDFTFFVDGVPTDTIDISPGQAVIRIHGVGERIQPRFVTNPVDWFLSAEATNAPIPTPDVVAVHRDGDTFCTIVDFNKGTRDEQFFFRVSVDMGGRVVTSVDPTIVNRKIGGAQSDIKPHRVGGSVCRRERVSTAA